MRLHYLVKFKICGFLVKIVMLENQNEKFYFDFTY